jgi:pteridine reductase
MQEGGQPLAGKTALVTGAARRVGAAIARALHEAGANLVLHYRHSASAAQELVRDLESARPGSVHAVQADLLVTARLPALVDEAARAFGGLDILVNNASSFYPTPLGEITEAAWEDLLGTNLKAPLFLSQAAAPHLAAANGLILNLVDIHGLRPLRRHPVYSIAKGGLVLLTKSLARELAPRVRVNAIAPGPILWPEDADPALKERILARTLLGHEGSPSDIARAALFFASDGPFITGQVLCVDGGRSVNW